MNGRILILRDGCGYSWEIRSANFVVQGLCTFRTPEKAVRSARHYGDMLWISLDEEVEQRCK
jgi:hypothetical protein